MRRHYQLSALGPACSLSSFILCSADVVNGWSIRRAVMCDHANSETVANSWPCVPTSSETAWIQLRGRSVILQYPGRLKYASGKTVCLKADDVGGWGWVDHSLNYLTIKMKFMSILEFDNWSIKRLDDQDGKDLQSQIEVASPIPIHSKKKYSLNSWSLWALTVNLVLWPCCQKGVFERT